MSITVVCTCGKSLNAPDSLAGRHAKCPRCGTKFLVPTIVADADQITDPTKESSLLLAAAPSSSSVNAINRPVSIELQVRHLAYALVCLAVAGFLEVASYFPREIKSVITANVSDVKGTASAILICFAAAMPLLLLAAAVYINKARKLFLPLCLGITMMILIFGLMDMLIALTFNKGWIRVVVPLLSIAAATYAMLTSLSIIRTLRVDSVKAIGNAN